MDATQRVKRYEGSKTCAAVLTSHFQVRIMLIDNIFGVIYYKRWKKLRETLQDMSMRDEACNGIELLEE